MMRFSLPILEERIVLDAAGVDIAQPDGGADAGDGADAAVDDANPVVDTAQPGLDGSESGIGADAGDAGPRVLVVASSVADGDDLAAAVGDGVLVVRYDVSNDTPADLLAAIDAALGGTQAESIALAMHEANGDGTMLLGENIQVDMGSLLTDAGQQSFFGSLGEMVQEDGRVDLLTCNFAVGDEGAMALSLLESLTGRDVAASTDLTGNAAYGGDWMLEAGGVDAASIYFDSEALGAFDGALALSQQTLLPGGGADSFGFTMDVDGDYAIVGAPYSTVDGFFGAGAAWLFDRSGGSWAQTQKFVIPGADAGESFGESVAIDYVASQGDYAVVIGAPSVPGNNGAAYMVYRNEGGAGAWGGGGNNITGDVGGEYSKIFVAKDGGAGDSFGTAVDIDNGTILVGATGWDGGATTDQGAAYVFTYQGGTWGASSVADATVGDEVGSNGYVARLTGSDSTDGSFFGNDVAVSGTTAVIGAQGHSGGRGAAYIFEDGGGWAETTKLVSGALNAGDSFGFAVSVAGDRVAVGASMDNNGGTGAVYVYGRDTGGVDTWGQIQKINGEAGGDDFGWSVDLGGNYLAVGAEEHGGSNTGAAYLYEWTGSQYGLVQKYTEGTNAKDWFGSAVSVQSEADGYTLLVGQYGDDAAGADAGAAYAYRYTVDPVVTPPVVTPPVVTPPVVTPPVVTPPVVTLPVVTPPVVTPPVVTPPVVTPPVVTPPFVEPYVSPFTGTTGGDSFTGGDSLTGGDTSTSGFSSGTFSGDMTVDGMLSSPLGSSSEPGDVENGFQEWIQPPLNMGLSVGLSMGSNDGGSGSSWNLDLNGVGSAVTDPVRIAFFNQGEHTFDPLEGSAATAIGQAITSLRVSGIGTSSIGPRANHLPTGSLGLSPQTGSSGFSGWLVNRLSSLSDIEKLF